MNAITVTGNLGRDPQTFEYGQDGRKAVRLTIANTEDRGGPRERTNWVTVVAFGNLAENLGSLQKGDRVIATGEISVRSWKGEDDKYQERWQVVADEVGVSLLFARLKPVESAPVDEVPEPEDARSAGEPLPPAETETPETKPPKSRASKAKTSEEVPA